jgi:putative peptidoglycan lipid II flippase
LTADVLLYYAVSLWAVAGVRIVVQALYALQDTRAPVKAAVVSIGTNILLMNVLAGPMGPPGLALAISLASVLNLVLLLVYLHKKIGALIGRRVLATTAQSGLASVMMAAGVWALACRVVPATLEGTLELLVALTGCVAAGIGIYAGISLLMGSPELKAVLQLVRGKEQTR